MIKFRLVNTELTPICSICDTQIVKKTNFLETIGDKHKLVAICEDCAYAIHCAYEGNM